MSGANVLPVIEDYSKGKTYKGINTFDCGDETINKYVKENLRRDGNRDNKNILVLLDPSDNDSLLGFVSCHLFILAKPLVPAELYDHSLPKNVPVVKLSMIAVDNKHKNEGHGWSLLQEAIEHAYTVYRASKDIKGVFLDAKPDVIPFYERIGFVKMPNENESDNTTQMILPISKVVEIKEGKSTAESSKTKEL